MASKLLFEVPSLLIAMVGWLATALVILNRVGLPAVQRRSLLFSTLVLWMSASFGSLVARGMLTAEEATTSCGVVSLTFGLVVWFSRPRVSQTESER
ncbi:MAG: hypothetical protein H7Y32_13550 [Chloroflexales bacterium]|nr:hypothetical protein [Chloroflexales bacterium]